MTAAPTSAASALAALASAATPEGTTKKPDENAALRRVGKTFRFVYDTFEKFHDILLVGAKATTTNFDPLTLNSG
jgi:hypothetical protein